MWGRPGLTWHRNGSVVIRVWLIAWLILDGWIWWVPVDTNRLHLHPNTFAVYAHFPTAPAYWWYWSPQQDNMSQHTTNSSRNKGLTCPPGLKMPHIQIRQSSTVHSWNVTTHGVLLNVVGGRCRRCRTFLGTFLSQRKCSSTSLFSQLNTSYWGCLTLRIADLFSITSTRAE